MFQLLKYLQAFKAATGITLRELAGFVSGIFALGAPPPLLDAAAVREWLRNLVQITKDIAAETPTELDDKATAMLAGVLENDAVWQVLYSTFILIVDGDFLFDEKEEAELSSRLAIAMAGQDDDKVQTIEPLVIIAIIRALIELFRQWRERTAS